MQEIADLDLPNLPMAEPAFSEDPLPQFPAAGERHPWLATCTFGFVITQYQVMRDLLWLDQSMTTANQGEVVRPRTRGRAAVCALA
jgi:hypothetical protein